MKALRLNLVVAAVCCLPFAGAQIAPAAQATVNSSPFYADITDPVSLKARSDAHLAKAQQALDRLLAVRGSRTVENTLRPYDDIQIEMEAASGPCRVLSALHPDERMRTAADEVRQRADVFTSNLNVNRAVHDAIAAIDLRRADAETRFYVERELRNFRRNGATLDQATHARLAQLNQDLNAATREFLRNIQNNPGSITVASAAELDGLPADFIARHTPDANGAITLTTNDSDYRPVLTFAKRDDVRKRLYLSQNNRAYPINMAVLDRILAIRTEIARLLGFASWAEYDIAPRMAGSAEAASDFIDRIVEVSRERTKREFDELLARKRRDVPGATTIGPWESIYYLELVRRESYDFDALSVRPYFAYDRVKQGVFDVTSRLYGVTIKATPNVPVWDPSVEAYEMLENGKPIGRFYLDLRPRRNKQGTGALTGVVRTGVAGRQLPETVMYGALPGGQPGDPGLLTHDDVQVTMFHEFGHVVHQILSARHRWFGVTRVSEADFIEAPSQMFEEWTWDPATLATFAKHYQTNEPIPAELVARMRRANDFGKAIGPTGLRPQMIVARYTLDLNNRDPKSIDTTALMRDVTNALVPFPYVDGTHRQTSFTQLGNPNYTASYYTYMWSLVIAKDLFSKFDPTNLLSPTVARRYRDTVLAPGGAKPAAALVQDFLGRPFNAKAYEAWLNR
ncbi:MAG: Zn-dependent oligopeptidase [Acidobacteriia bacterium]|nr:Zn-dependent oligopeptidase [Terriglobia bacterium]